MAQKSDDAKTAADGGHPPLRERPPLLEKLANDFGGEASSPKPKQSAFALLGTGCPLPAPPGRIPKLPSATVTRASEVDESGKTSSTDQRLEKLERLITAQAEQTEGIVSVLSNITNNNDYPYYPDEDGELGEEEPCDELSGGVDLTAAIDMPAQSTAMTEVPTEPAVSGFAGKFAASSYGSEIDTGIASSLQYLLTNRLGEKPLNDICDLYDTPKNTRYLCVPKVNPQIWESLSPHARNNDLKLQKVEKLMVKGVTAFAKTTDGLTEHQENGLTCLTAAIFELNMLRREMIKPGLHDKFANLCKPSIPVTENLFGDDLTRHIKDIDEVHKATGKMVRYPRFAPYPQKGRGKGRGNGQNFLGRGQQPQRQQQRGGYKSFQQKRGRGRGAGRGQQGQQPQTQ